MKLVIEIPEDVYTRLFDNGIQDNEIAVDDVCEMARALRLGRPLEAQPRPCEDCISRQAVIEHICESKECYKEECKGRILKRCPDLQWVFDLPSVTPKYTDEEIDRAQAVEQAYVDKMVELAVEESRREWLNSFDTDSATKCFEAVNLLKQRLEGEADD